MTQRLRYYGGGGMDRGVAGGKAVRNNRARDPVKFLPDSGQVVRVIPDWQTPKDIFPDGT